LKILFPTTFPTTGNWPWPVKCFVNLFSIKNLFVKLPFFETPFPFSPSTSSKLHKKFLERWFIKSWIWKKCFSCFKHVKCYWNNIVLCDIC
jgi:hypothetical protein